MTVFFKLFSFPIEKTLLLRKKNSERVPAEPLRKVVKKNVQKKMSKKTFLPILTLKMSTFVCNNKRCRRKTPAKNLRGAFIDLIN